MINIYQKYLSLLAELECYNQDKIPLCAAETYVSPFVKNALKSDFEGKYCMQNKNYEEIKDLMEQSEFYEKYKAIVDANGMTDFFAPEDESDDDNDGSSDSE